MMMDYLNRITRRQSQFQKNSIQCEPVRIECRIVFVKIIEIDTKNESFEAEICIECSWLDENLFRILLDPNLLETHTSEFAQKTDLTDFYLKYLVRNISLIDFSKYIFWTPDIVVENSIETQEEIKYRLELIQKDPNFLAMTPSNLNRVFDNLSIKVTEMRKLKGIFYERLELNDFPIDLQELSVRISTRLPIDQALFVENKTDLSKVDRANFFEEQQWELLHHVRVRCDQYKDDLNGFVRSRFMVSAYVVRKYQFYLYNAYMLILFVTCIGFTAFSFAPNYPQFRCQLTSLLLLTLVNFRWIISNSIPSISYLTLLDKYSIGSIIFLVALFIWHTFIATYGLSLLASETQARKIMKNFTATYNQTEPSQVYLLTAKIYDSYLFYSFMVVYFLFNLFFLVSFFKISKSINVLENKSKTNSKRD